MIKPDGVGRGLIGACIQRLEQRGLKLVGLKFQRLSRKTAETHYAEHKGKPFFEDLVAFITSGPTVQMVWEGRDAVAVVRRMNGATDSAQAEPGTIRGDFSLSKQRNVIHASNSPETAAREIALYFKPEELIEYSLPVEDWLR